MKPTVFVGSSSEGISIAKKVKSSLSDVANVSIWNEKNVFEFNDSPLGALMRESSLFDFGILIFTKDDDLTKRESLFKVARDNVVFEFGLLLGKVGTNRAFAVVESGVELPSDFKSQNVQFFKRNARTKDTISQACDSIKSAVVENFKLSELHLIPSTVLALGYFNHFVKPVCLAMQDEENQQLNGIKWKDFQFDLVMPEKLPADMRAFARKVKRDQDLIDVKVVTSTREYPLYMSQPENKKGSIRLVDAPTTLGSSHEAIELVLSKSHVGKSSKQVLLEQRELSNFAKTLSFLVDSDGDTNGIVRVETG